VNLEIVKIKLDVYKKIKVFVGIVFLCFSFLQINDPDYFYWVSIYLLTSLFTFYSIYKTNKYVKFLSGFYFLSSLSLIYKGSDNEVIMYIFPENTNEVFGLMLCSIWLYFLPSINKNMD
tara:strand:- start:2004 stop:2360 length:357 start_codon:yes stop_codon:yes gene_type:complete